MAASSLPVSLPPGASSRTCAPTSRPASIRAAACELGIGQTTARQHQSGLYKRTGCPNAAQAADRLGQGERGGQPEATDGCGPTSASMSEPVQANQAPASRESHTDPVQHSHLAHDRPRMCPTQPLDVTKECRMRRIVSMKPRDSVPRRSRGRCDGDDQHWHSDREHE